jgi:DNA-binding transcriptional LysR family regulator
MTLKQLEAFYWAAKLGTFAIAAQRLHVTQSSLSKRVAELEADLGQTLFDRNARRATLTAAGEILLEKAGPMLEFERDIRASLAQQSQGVRGTCRFGLTELSATTWFPALAARLEQEHPAITLEPTVGLSRAQENAVVRGDLDLATIAGPASSAEIASQVISEIEFVWTASPARLRRRTVLTAEHFATLPVVSNAHDSGLNAVFESWSAANHIRAVRTIPCNSRAAIIALTVAGVGLSFQPRRYVQPLFNRGLLVPLESVPPLPTVPYSLIWRRDDDRKLVQVMRDLVEQEADFGSENLFWSPGVA